MDFGFKTRLPEFLCKGVCLGGALHGKRGMKRAETRESQMKEKNWAHPTKADEPK